MKWAVTARSRVLPASTRPPLHPPRRARSLRSGPTRRSCGHCTGTSAALRRSSPISRGISSAKVSLTPFKRRVTICMTYFFPPFFASVIWCHIKVKNMKCRTIQTCPWMRKPRRWQALKRSWSMLAYHVTNRPSCVSHPFNFTKRLPHSLFSSV